MVENAFFEHLGLVGGFLLVAWHDIRDGYQSQQRQQFASGENVMISRSTHALLIAIAALFPASVAFAQTREIFGPVLPMIYDGQGGRHYCLNGYNLTV